MSDSSVTPRRRWPQLALAITAALLAGFAILAAAGWWLLPRYAPQFVVDHVPILGLRVRAVVTNDMLSTQVGEWIAWEGIHPSALEPYLFSGDRDLRFAALEIGLDSLEVPDAMFDAMLPGSDAEEAWLLLDLLNYDSSGRLDRRRTAAIVSLLSHADLNVREVATASLYGLRDPSAVPALVARLRDGGNHVDVYVALGSIGTPEAIAALREGLSDPNPSARREAATALCYLGDPTGPQTLMEVIETKVDVWALRALCASGRPQAIEFVVGYLTHADAEIVRHARKALGSIGDPRGEPELPWYAAMTPQAHVAPFETDGRPDIDKLLAAMKDERMKWPAASYIKTHRVDDRRLIQALERRVDVRYIGSDLPRSTLIMLGYEPVVSDAIQAIASDTEGWYGWRETAGDLVRAGNRDPRLLAALAEQVRTDVPAVYSIEALGLLAQCGDEQAIQAIVKLYEDYPLRTLECVVPLLQADADPRIVELLHRAMNRYSLSNTGMQITFALAMIGDSQGTAGLIDLLAHAPDADTRAGAADLLVVCLNDPAARQALRKAADEDWSPRVRHAARQSLDCVPP